MHACLYVRACVRVCTCTLAQRAPVCVSLCKCMHVYIRTNTIQTYHHVIYFSQEALATRAYTMVLRDKMMESWHLYAHTRARKRTAVLRFAQGVGRAEMRLLEQQHQQQEQQQHNTGENQHTHMSNVRTANSATSAANSATTAAPAARLERAARVRRHMHESLRDHVAETIALMARRAAGITILSKETYPCEKRLMKIDL